MQLILFNYLAGNSVRFADLITPISSSNWNNWQLGQNDSSSDGSGHFFRALNTQTHMAIVVANSYKSLWSKKHGKNDYILVHNWLSIV